jgi:hypothetical protein
VESEAWKNCRTNIPLSFNHVRRKKLLDPYSRERVLIAGECLRHEVIFDFPGIDERAKLNAVFAAAPPWLIWFTFADYTAALLGLKLPDLSSVTGFARSEEMFDRWWGLPEDAFECHPWPNGPDCEPLSCTDLNLLRPEMEWDELLTHRQRRRALATSIQDNKTDNWPLLVPLEILQMDDETRRSLLAKAGSPYAEDKRHPEFCGMNPRSTHVRPRRGGA